MPPFIPTFACVPAALVLAACAVTPSPARRDSVPGTSTAGASAGVTGSPAPAPPGATGSVVDSVQASFTRMLTQQNTGFDEPAELAIRDRASLESAWSRVFNQVQGNPAPDIDFSRETVILVALGRLGTGGHTVHVDGVGRSAEGAVVSYTASAPAEGCDVSQSMTSPVDVVRTPRIPGTVRFARHDAVQRC